uniref:Thymidine kinase n=1 Tax=Wood mouse herpesvirus TaxID=432370 RepID=D0PPB0_9GAMA|nr:thymidine kinase [Wood mouse herpesvirus]
MASGGKNNPGFQPDSDTEDEHVYAEPEEVYDTPFDATRHQRPYSLLRPAYNRQEAVGSDDEGIYATPTFDRIITRRPSTGEVDEGVASLPRRPPPEQSNSDSDYEEVSGYGQDARQSIYNTPRRSTIKCKVSSGGENYDIPRDTQANTVTVQTTTHRGGRHRSRVPRVLVRHPNAGGNKPDFLPVDKPLPSVPQHVPQGYEEMAGSPPPERDVRSPRPQRRPNPPVIIFSDSETESDVEAVGGRQEGSKGDVPTSWKRLLMTKDTGAKSKTAFDKLKGSFEKFMGGNTKTEDTEGQRSVVRKGGDRNTLQYSYMSKMTTDNPAGPTQIAHVLYFDGGIGVGKTTALEAAAEFLHNILVIPEPIPYWTSTFDKNVCQQIYDVVRTKEKGKKHSKKVLQCQMAFAQPFFATQHLLRRTCLGTKVSDGTCNNHVVIDRHMLSPTVLFPCLFFRLGVLKFGDLISLLSMFSAQCFDNIILFKLNPRVAVTRIKERGRNPEGVINHGYLKLLNEVVDAVFCAWELLAIVPPEVIVEAILSQTPVKRIFQKVGFAAHRARLMEHMFTESIFNDLRENVQRLPIIGSSIPNLLHKLCHELSKPQMFRLDAGQFPNDIPGLWTHIYTQILTDPAIKTCILKWNTLEKGISGGDPQ